MKLVGECLDVFAGHRLVGSNGYSVGERLNGSSRLIVVVQKQVFGGDSGLQTRLQVLKYNL